ncbi:MAG: hypothetical protein HOH20_02500 [Rhodospirillaceae bacterium]|nr:hypothetical protein [Rhodospirillaceae bacterium]MBT5239313.1 hypothetical protein [Rhodospirillaceae bacterium]MBT5566331.1 hypothetical protein [Rhodospirillaceae bacterium]MBT6088424.1 hypothetical protein [Rhodospirillaceae bacterium]MBT6962186.1 hypothetical protein [Rhodospirillaceae bacterium]
MTPRAFCERAVIVLTAMTCLSLSGGGSVNAETQSTQSDAMVMTELGTIDFPNSGNEDAQQAFMTGVKALYSFQFDDAAVAFRAAQNTDQDFALAYWGEAMSLNHTLWGETDRDAARKILAQFAATPDARADKTPAGKERGFMQAIDVLYGEGDKLTRDKAYSQAMKDLYEAYPGDNEIATFYALSVLGTVRPGDKGVARQMRATAISQAVFAKNPNHPGAAHFIIHALDDPEHAILALPAARTYASIAPDAPHALHMPSHIFVQLGMWDDVVRSNIASYNAAVAIAERTQSERGRSEFHSLSWRLYGDLQLGNLDGAEEALALARATEEVSPTNRVHNGTMGMLARYVIETENWDELKGLALEKRDNSNLALQFAVGLSAAKRGDLADAEKALENLIALREKSEARTNGVYRAKIISVSEKELAAAIADSRGESTAAEALLRDAVAIETTLNAPSGPPVPVKPSFEMYGEFLLAAGRLSEAAEQFEFALTRTPNRTKSVLGLAKAQPVQYGEAR